MFTKRLTGKVLLILAITLTSGLVSLGGIAVWLQGSSTMNLAHKNSRNIASLIIEDIDEYMMKGSNAEVDKYIAQLRKNPFVLDAKVFNETGRESNAGEGAAANGLILKAIQQGNNVEEKRTVNGVHTMNIAVPLANDARCRGCHDATAKYLGGILLTTSIQDVHESIMKLTLLLAAVGLAFFFILLCTIYFFFKKAIIRHIQMFGKTVSELAGSEGDLDMTIPVSSDDEIGALASGINSLIGKMRNIVGDMAKDAEDLSAAACQLSGSSETMVGSIQRAVDQTHAVATASEEMAATSTEIAHNCTAAADCSRKASDLAASGSGIVTRTVDVMNRISGRVRESAETIERLGARSDQIGEIIGTIEDIADQTNLLALNAAIEAARAGEQGRGFAVVADEVRALAERTTKATREIGTMIKSIQDETRRAVDSMEQGVKDVEEGTSEASLSGSALNEILEQINSVSMQVNMIATATEQQTATTCEISGSIQQITEVVQESARGAEEAACAATRLSRLAEEFQRMVGQFKRAS
ncbi:MAG TPA: methyl-accepting chemotaxis protein [Geobacteraceae bacterium]